MKPDVESRVRKYLVDRGWDNLRPSDLAKSISIEAAELLEIFQWSDATQEEVKANPAQLEKLKGELADVLIYALDMSILLELDTATLIHDKLKKIEEKYPAKLMREAAGKTQPGTDSLYHQIKRQHRHQPTEGS